MTEEKNEKDANMGFTVFIFIYTIHLAYLKLYTKSQVVAEKFLTEKNVHMYFIGLTEGKNETLKKEGKIWISIYTIHFAYLKVYTKIENTGSNWSREIFDKNCHWRERKNE